MNKFLTKILLKMDGKYLTDSRDTTIFSEIREMEHLPTRDMERVPAFQHEGNIGSGTPTREIKLSENQKAPAIRDSLTWTRRDLHSFLCMAMTEFYYINYRPGSTNLLYHEKEKEPTNVGPLFCHADKHVVTRSYPVITYSISKST